MHALIMIMVIDHTVTFLFCRQESFAIMRMISIMIT